MWVYSDFIGVRAKCGVLQHAATPFTNYHITIKVEVRWGYLLTTIILNSIAVVYLIDILINVVNNIEGVSICFINQLFHRAIDSVNKCYDVADILLLLFTHVNIEFSTNLLQIRNNILLQTLSILIHK
jgi:hypothetical protein